MKKSGYFENIITGSLTFLHNYRLIFEKITTANHFLRILAVLNGT